MKRIWNLEFRIWNGGAFLLSLLGVALFAHMAEAQSLRNLIPFPQQAIVLPDDSLEWRWNRQVQIIIGDSVDVVTEDVADSLQAFIADQTGVRISVVRRRSWDRTLPWFMIGMAGELQYADSLLTSLQQTDGALTLHPEGYALICKNRAGALIGADQRGLMYGWQTLQHILHIEADVVRLQALLIYDYPDLPDRFLLFGTNFQVAANIPPAIALEQRAWRSRLNHTTVSDTKMDRLDQVPDWYFTNIRQYLAEINRLNIEPVPGVAGYGYSEGMLWDNPNLVEGIPVVNAKLLVHGGVANLVPDPGMTLTNGDFEQVNNNRFAGWTSQEDAGVTIFDDTQTVYSGRHSVRMTNFNGANTRFTMLLNCQPHRNYHFTIMCKNQGFSAGWGVQILPFGWRNNNIDRTLAFPDFGVTGDRDWTKLEVNFNSLDYSQIRLYFGVWSGTAGTVWFDDARLSEIAFVNLIRRSGCPLVITNQDSSVIYQEGQDFAQLTDSLCGHDPWPGAFDVFHEPPLLHTQGGRIHDGDTLLASFYHPILISGWQVTACLADTEMYRWLEEDAVRIRDLINPQAFFLSHDEIRVIGWDEPCRAIGSPAQIISRNVNQCETLYRRVVQGCPLYLWSDMFDPFHNAVANYYEVNGSLVGAGDGIREDIRIVDWNEPNMQQSLDYFSQHNHPVIGSADCSYDMHAARVWGEGIRRCATGRGMMFTTWSGRYDHLEDVGAYMWSLGPHFIFAPPVANPPLNRVAFDAQVFIGDDPASDGVTVDRVEIHYQARSDTTFQSTMMQSGGGENWQGTVNLHNASGLRYYLEALDNHGNVKRSPRNAPESYYVMGQDWQGVSTQPNTPLPNQFKLLGAYPNPFNGRMVLKAELPREGRVHLSVIDATGREILANDVEGRAGSLEIPLNGEGWSSGVYLARLTWNGVTLTGLVSCVK